MRTLFSLTLILVVMSGCNSDSPKTLYSKQEVLELHNSLYTIDSHTDTPMSFTQTDFDFGKRHDPYSSGSKVDLPRMKEGGLDGIFMAVFLGQRERSPEGNQKAYEKTLQIFDSIYSVSENLDDIEIVRTKKEFLRNTSDQKQSFFIGIENGYAIGNNIDLIDTFHNLGARYITLCHTKNNDICDSSNDTTEHNGLSEFGEKVVKRMNELGMMIDISHASDETFYDVLELSTQPVIASHSCARAICDNPRNLDDEMLKALAENKGVIQMCILSAYVETPLPNPERDSAKKAVWEKHGNYYELDDKGKAAFLEDWYAVDRNFPAKLSNVAKVVDHIDHMVEVAGINHVGIGTDFDGGGGVEDCYDVSQLPNITAELLKRGYSKKEIQKIWGGNLLRVLNQIDKS